MKKISLLLLLSFIAAVSAVGQSVAVGEARYGIRYIDKEASGSRLPDYVNLSPHAGSVAEQMEFSLIFESDISKFDYIDHDLKMDERELITTLAYFGYSSSIWQDEEKTYTEAPIGFFN